MGRPVGGYRQNFSGRSTNKPPRRSTGHPALLILLIGGFLALSVIGVLEMRLRPVVSQIAAAQANNKLTAVISDAILTDLAARDMSYQNLVTIQRDDSGAITALTTNMASMNVLRTQLVSDILDALNQVDISIIRIPLGSLIDLDLLWARGPSIQVRSMTVGTVSADFESEFTSAGVNQTMHSIWAQVTVPLTLMLPGGTVETEVNTRLCVAETVIVGKVPETFVQLGEAQP